MSTSASKPKIERITKIIKPKCDTREYRGLVLPNRLRVVLVSDPSTDKSAGALSVNVGSMADPETMQGLAHFLEHALFLTTKKYPEENFFKNFIVQHGGRTNAFTSLNETNYFFDVGPEALLGALDRFAQFFIEPLFPRDLIERELQSIQFEFENKITNDSTRFFRLRKLYGDPKHPFSKFSTGNRQTLTISNELFNEMIKFYEQWYSANIMTFSVIGKESLDELERMVVPLFGQIVNRNVQEMWFDKHPYTADYCRRITKAIPFVETRKMIMFFPLPDITKNKRLRDALSYITFLLGHEGPGSLLAELKERGYSTLCEVDTFFYNGFGFLDIDIDLTQGITKNVEIVSLLFAYIEMLKRKPPDGRIYEEIRKVGEIKFHFRDKISPQACVKWICSSLHSYSFETVLSARSLMGPFDASAIQSLLKYLDLQYFNMQVISPIFKTKEAIPLQTDPIYGTEYAVSNLTEAELTIWAKVDLKPALFLPTPNEFIPENFTLKPSPKAGTEIPDLVHSNEFLKIWHLKDSTFNVPKAFYGFSFKNQLVQESPLNANLVALFIKLFYDYVNQKFYPADLVGIVYNISTNKLGLEITVEGFNDKLDVFLLAFVHELINFKINPIRSDMIYGLYINSLKIFDTWPISTMLYMYLDNILTANCWTFNELIEAFPHATDDKIMPLMRSIWSNCQVEVLAHGNIDQAEAVRLASKVSQLLNSNSQLKPYFSSLHLLYDKNRDIHLPGTCEYALTNAFHENHGFLVHYQMGILNLQQQALLELMHQIISEPYFNQIRMSEQLAYVTFVSPKLTVCGSVGLDILIQSAYELKYIESRVDAFLNSLEDHLKKMPLEVFNKERDALITHISEKPKQMFSLSWILWKEILLSQYVFNRNTKLVAYLKRFKPSDILELYRSTLRPDSPGCRRLLITIKSAKTKEMKGKLHFEAAFKHAEEQSPSKETNSFRSNSPSQETKNFSSSTKSEYKGRIKIKHIRKFKCECSLSPIPKIIIDKI